MVFEFHDDLEEVVYSCYEELDELKCELDDIVDEIGRDKNTITENTKEIETLQLRVKELINKSNEAKKE